MGHDVKTQVLLDLHCKVRELYMASLAVDRQMHENNDVTARARIRLVEAYHQLFEAWRAM